MNTPVLSSVLVGLFFAAGFVSDAVSKESDKVAEKAGKETLVATLTKDQVADFASYVKVKNLRLEEVTVVARMQVEKQRELKGFLDEMSKEFGMAVDKSYSFERESRALYILSTNRVDKAGTPEKKLVKKVKTDGEAQYLARLMVARKLTEQQLFVLRQLKAEKSKEWNLADAKLRQTFKLATNAVYRLDETSGQVFLVGASVPKTQAKDSAVAGSGKAVKK